MFHALGEEQLTHIIDLRLAELHDDAQQTGRLRWNLRAAARAAIFKAGYDKAYGARPLKRAVQRMVQDKLAVQDSGWQSVLHGDVVTDRRRTRTVSWSFLVAGRDEV